jgi:hypothetical protein
VHRLLRPRSTPLARGAPEVWRDSRPIERATRHASGALATGTVNWKVAPGPTLHEAQICPP